MTISQKLLVFVCLGSVLASAHSVSAQIDAGLLGRRYVAGSIFTESLRNRNIDNGNGADLTVNLPLAPSLDFLAGGSYERFSDYSVEDKRLFGTLRAFKEFSGVRPFVDLSLINTWQTSKVGSVSYSASDGIWGIGGGAEIPIADATAVIGRVAYQKFFKSDNGHYTTYSVGLHHWFNQQVGGQALVTFWESDSVTYSVGLNVRF